MAYSCKILSYSLFLRDNYIMLRQKIYIPKASRLGDNKGNIFALLCVFIALEQFRSYMQV